MPNVEGLLSPSFLNNIIILFGASMMYVFSLFKGFDGSVGALKKLLPGHRDVFYARCDFVILILAGSIIGKIFFHPQDAIQALSAGFGWTGALSILVSQHSHRNSVAPPATPDQAATRRRIK